MTTPANRRHAVAATALAAALALVPLLRSPAVADGPDGGTAHPHDDGEHPHAPARCREQHPQPFLIRSAYATGGNMSHEERVRRHAAHEAAIRYRTEQYGWFDGFGDRAWNPHPPRFYAETTHFMGLPVRVHHRIVPVLACVEHEIHRTCASEHYTAHALAGIRFHNTYHTGEITNHAYGIAVDIDPDRNTCCGCVGPWARAPQCAHPRLEDRMAMPQCWVHAFERYGFYWLGHDPMQDTMHFEFLGDPSRIER